jgi:hypothetical protein
MLYIWKKNTEIYPPSKRTANPQNLQKIQKYILLVSESTYIMYIVQNENILDILPQKER